jgi:ribosomal protein L39E
MTRYKSPAKKNRLAKKIGQTKWAPFWTVPKIYGKNRRVHPGRHTHIKRSWRRGTRMKV